MFSAARDLAYLNAVLLNFLRLLAVNRIKSAFLLGCLGLCCMCSSCLLLV